MNQVPAFEQLKRLAEVSLIKDELRISFAYNDFLSALRGLLAGVAVDEDWYLEQYPDVRTAIEEGQVGSAADHFVDSGYFEGRLPASPEFDEEWYLAEYPDVGDLIEKGKFDSGYQHFLALGYHEGRAPRALSAGPE